ncbi:MAG: hypothetical protein HY808_12860 [Nitrospirae bacterium]|nr:hypothetical protein [Nitrospirota bacterium]
MLITIKRNINGKSRCTGDFDVEFVIGMRLLYEIRGTGYKYGYAGSDI